jgi:ligand-binding sensor domain-containing protein/signal transduction histidine kinase
MRRFYLILIFLAYSFGSSAQFHYSIRNYKAVDGLPQSQVNIMLEDKNGYLWIGTEGGGLARFDGREFKVYTTLDGLLSNIVSYLKLDERENLWIVHPRGLTRFDGESFKTFSQPGGDNPAKRVRRAFEQKDTLFFITAPGYVGKIYKDSVYFWSRPLKKNLLVSYLHITPDKTVLMYLSDSTFYVCGDKPYTFGHSEYFNRVYGLMFNYDNDVWIRTDSGYFVVDVRNKKFLRKELPVKDAVVFYDTINDLFWARDRQVLLKEKILPDGKVRIDTVLSDVNIRQILVDSEGNTWLATAGSGLYKYFIQDFDRCSSEKLKGVMAIHEDRTGATWIGSISKGLVKIKKGKVSYYTDKTDAYRNQVISIAESPTGEIWVGASSGLGKYLNDEDKFQWFTRADGLSNVSIMGGIQFDKKGGMWVGTHGGGLNYYDGEQFRAFTTKNGLKSNMISALYYSDFYNALFIGSEFGISALTKEKIQSLPLVDFENTTVLSIHPYQDSLLLVGSGGAGVAIYNPRTSHRKMLSTHHGLPSDFIYFVAADSDNYLWIGSEKGITRVKLDAKLEIVENLHYDYDNGLTGVETNQNAFYLSGDEKYFGLIDGLYQFNQLQAYSSPFKLHLTDVEILYGQYSARSHADSLYSFFKIPHKPQLPPDQNHITFYFNKVHKRYPKSIKFRYFLENFDKRWSQPSSTNHVTYSNIPPGDYIFRVETTDNKGGWVRDQLVYPFTVKAPFYQTTAFVLGMIILAAGAITLILYIRVKQRINNVMMLERIRAKEQETLRKEIARDFHDEMGNQLTRIINYVSLLKLNGNGRNGNGNGSSYRTHEDLYAKVEDSAKYLYTGTRDFIWSIDPGNDELSKLFIHIRDFGEKLFEEKDIQFRANNEVRDKMKLPYGFSREANLIFKEAMTNAFKYSNARNVTFTLRRNVSEFEFTLEDDGVGFHTGDVRKTNGLKNIGERADRINGVLRIHSIKDSGTKIILYFKLNKSLKYGLAL